MQHRESEPSDESPPIHLDYSRPMPDPVPRRWRRGRIPQRWLIPATSLMPSYFFVAHVVLQENRNSGVTIVLMVLWFVCVSIAITSAVRVAFARENFWTYGLMFCNLMLALLGLICPLISTLE